MKYLIFIILVQACSIVKAQGSISKGNTYPAIGTFNRTYFTKGNEILALKVSGKSIFIQKLNAKTLSQIESKEFTDFPEGFNFEGVKEVAGRYYFFYSVWAKPN